MPTTSSRPAASAIRIRQAASREEQEKAEVQKNQQTKNTNQNDDKKKKNNKNNMEKRKSNNEHFMASRGCVQRIQSTCMPHKSRFASNHNTA